MYNTEFKEQNYYLFDNNQVLSHRNTFHFNKIDENLSLNNDIPEINVVQSFPNYFAHNNYSLIENERIERRKEEELKEKKKIDKMNEIGKVFDAFSLALCCCCELIN